MEEQRRERHTRSCERDHDRTEAEIEARELVQVIEEELAQSLPDTRQKNEMCSRIDLFLSRFAGVGDHVDCLAFGNNFVGLSSKTNTDSCMVIPENVVRISRPLL